MVRRRNISSCLSKLLLKHRCNALFSRFICSIREITLHVGISCQAQINLEGPVEVHALAIEGQEGITKAIWHLLTLRFILLSSDQEPLTLLDLLLTR